MKDEKPKKNMDSTGITVLYYFIQFATVHFVYFGLVLQPSAYQLYSAFNIAGIIAALINFVVVFTVSIGFAEILLIVIMCLPYTIVLFWACLPVILYIVVLWQFVVAVMSYVSYVMFRRSLTCEKCVVVKCGAPGTGKTSSAMWQAVATAQRLWCDLRYKYHTMRYRVEKLARQGKAMSDMQLAVWTELEKAYEYYIRTPCVPCLWSNIPIMVGGRYASVLTRQHAQQQFAIPAYTVLFFDEVGAEFRVNESNCKILTVSDFWRLCRHFGEFRIYCTEQDRSNIYIDIRRVAHDNVQMISQDWVLRPLPFVVLWRVLRWLYLRKPEGRGYMVPILTRMAQALRYIGFRRFREVSTGNAEYAYKGKSKIRSYCLPTMLNCTYDDRTFRAYYKVRDKPVEVNIFSSLLML